MLGKWTSTVSPTQDGGKSRDGQTSLTPPSGPRIVLESTGDSVVDVMDVSNSHSDDGNSDDDLFDSSKIEPLKVLPAPPVVRRRSSIGIANAQACTDPF